MTDADFVSLVIDEEGGFTDRPADNGGATNFGITAAAWGRYRGFNRPATRQEVQAITRAQATAFYQGYLVGSPFRTVAYEPLRAALNDFAIHSGSARAARWLQRALGVPVNDGILDERTSRALALTSGRVVLNALTAARLRMFFDIVAEDATQAAFLTGWCRRALRFAELD